MGEGEPDRRTSPSPSEKMKSFKVKINFSQKVKAADEEEAISLSIEELISLFESGETEEFITVSQEELSEEED